ncbi:DMT family transporter [Holdemanella porci]|uniref:DMT family transporter n=1 Tax=Holdemanella TaxID=1573535 RepID=UPI002E767D22|nr:DMT family transporter [Holdemanella sp.]MEE0079603.1 DMT family transporter [Holdemanella sp.]
MKKGYIYTALSAIIFGLMPLLTKIIIARGATSLTIPFFRVFYVTIVLFFVLKIKKIDLHLEKRDLLSAILTSIFGSGLTIIILNESYNHVDTGIATSLHFLYPLFVAILCCFFYGEKIKKKQILSLSFALVGIICFMSKGNGSLFGYFLAIASGLTYAFYLVKMDKSGLVKMNALKLSFYLALFTTIEIFTMNLFMQDVVFKMDAIAYGLLLVLALSSSFLATVLLQKGVLLLGSTRASFICLLEPVTSMIVGILWLNEAFTFNKGLGGLAIIISLIIFLKE